MNPLCSSLSWKPQVQLCLEGRGLLQAGAKPLCPGWSARWSCATGPFCLLALQGNGSYWAFFFQGLIFVFQDTSACAPSAPHHQVPGEGGSSHSAQLLPKKVSFRLRAWKLLEEQAVHQTGAARGVDVSHGCCIVCCSCSELLLVPFSGEKKVRGISILTYVLFPKCSLPPFVPIHRRRWWEWGFVVHKLFCPRCLEWLGYSLPH